MDEESGERDYHHDDRGGEGKKSIFLNKTLEFFLVPSPQKADIFALAINVICGAQQMLPLLFYFYFYFIFYSIHRTPILVCKCYFPLSPPPPKKKSYFADRVSTYRLRDKSRKTKKKKSDHVPPHQNLHKKWGGRGKRR